MQNNSFDHDPLPLSSLSKSDPTLTSPPPIMSPKNDPTLSLQNEPGQEDEEYSSSIEATSPLAMSPYTNSPFYNTPDSYLSSPPFSPFNNSNVYMSPNRRMSLHHRSASLASLIDDLQSFSDEEGDNTTKVTDVLEVFQTHDKYGSGFLDKEQFFKSLEKLADLNSNLNIVLEQKEDLYDELNENGLVKYENILEVLEAEMELQDDMAISFPDDFEGENTYEEITLQDEIRAVFQGLDNQQTGFINHEQFGALCDELDLSHSKYEKSEYFHLADKTKRGKITLEEVFSTVNEMHKEGAPVNVLPLEISIDTVLNKDFLTSISHVQSAEVLKQMLLDLGQVVHDKSVPSIEEAKELAQKLEETEKEKEKLERSRQTLQYQLNFAHSDRLSLLHELNREKETKFEREKEVTQLLQTELSKTENELQQLYKRLSQEQRKTKALRSTSRQNEQENQNLNDVVQKLRSHRELLFQQLQDQKKSSVRITKEKEDLERKHRKTIFNLENKEDQLNKETLIKLQKTESENDLLKSRNEELVEETEKLLPTEEDFLLGMNTIRLEEEFHSDPRDSGHSQFPNPAEARPSLLMEMSDFPSVSDSECGFLDFEDDTVFPGEEAPAEWSNEEILWWLLDINMDKYKEMFGAQGFTGVDLLKLNQDMLHELGVQNADIKIIMSEIVSLREVHQRNLDKQEQRFREELARQETERLERERKMEAEMRQVVVKDMLDSFLQTICASSQKRQFLSIFHNRPLGFHCERDANDMTQVCNVGNMTFSVNVGCYVYSINDEPMYCKSHIEVLQALQTAQMPAKIIFTKIIDEHKECLRAENAKLKYQLQVARLAPAPSKQKKKRKEKCVIS